MQSLGNFMSYIGYGIGFAMDNYAGIILVEWKGNFFTTLLSGIQIRK